MGAYSFLAGRSWLAVLVLIPTVFAFDAVRKKQGQPYGWPEGDVGAKDSAGGGPRLRHLPVRGLSGSADRHHHQPVHGQGRVPDGHVRCAGAGVRPLSGPEGQRSALGQHGHRRGGPVYALHEERLRGIETSDWILLSCAVLFSFQIMSIDHFSPLVDGVRLSLIQFIVVAVESSAAALIFETPTLAEYGANFLPVFYCGVMSSGAGYTLQILGQKDLNPPSPALSCAWKAYSARWAAGCCWARTFRCGRAQAAPSSSPPSCCLSCPLRSCADAKRARDAAGGRGASPMS